MPNAVPIAATSCFGSASAFGSSRKATGDAGFGSGPLPPHQPQSGTAAVRARQPATPWKSRERVRSRRRRPCDGPTPSSLPGYYCGPSTTCVKAINGIRLYQKYTCVVNYLVLEPRTQIFTSMSPRVARCISPTPLSTEPRMPGGTARTCLAKRRRRTASNVWMWGDSSRLSLSCLS
jgi:hypothetical protein